MCRKLHVRKTKLGYRHMNSKDDGGISLAAKNAVELPPVFSIEVINPYFRRLFVPLFRSDHLGETEET